MFWDYFPGREKTFVVNSAKFLVKNCINCMCVDIPQTFWLRFVLFRNTVITFSDK